MSEQDWRGLLVRYMAHILDHEGISYVDSMSHLEEPLSDAEQDALKALEPEAQALYDRSTRWSDS